MNGSRVNLVVRWSALSVIQPFGTKNVNQLEYWKLSTKARSLVNLAVRAGDLPSPKTLTCIDCSKPAKVYDHRDYYKPLIVVPVCHSCNKRRGRANHSVTDEPINRDLEANIIKCLRCGHEWIPRKLPVLQCPKCKTVHFDKPKRLPDTRRD